MRTKNIVYTIAVTLITIIFASCKKEIQTSCYNGLTTLRNISNVNATVVLQTNGEYYIIEAGTIDIKLKPCDLSEEFKVNNLQVIITGETKLITTNQLEPCCTEGLVIGKIEKR
jgi:hypothetical protein